MKRVDYFLDFPRLLRVLVPGIGRYTVHVSFSKDDREEITFRTFTMYFGCDYGDEHRYTFSSVPLTSTFEKHGLSFPYSETTCEDIRSGIRVRVFSGREEIGQDHTPVEIDPALVFPEGIERPYVVNAIEYEDRADDPNVVRTCAALKEARKKQTSDDVREVLNEYHV